MKTHDNKRKLMAHIFGHESAVVKSFKSVLADGQFPTYGTEGLYGYMYAQLRKKPPKEPEPYNGFWLIHPDSPHPQAAALGRFLWRYSGDNLMVRFFKFLHLNLPRFHSTLCFRLLELHTRELDYGAIIYDEEFMGNVLSHRAYLQERLIGMLSGKSKDELEALFDDENFLTRTLSVVQYRLDRIPITEMVVSSLGLTHRCIKDFVSQNPIPVPDDFDPSELLELAEQEPLGDYIAKQPRQVLYLFWYLLVHDVFDFQSWQSPSEIGVCSIIYPQVRGLLEAFCQASDGDEDGDEE